MSKQAASVPRAGPRQALSARRRPPSPGGQELHGIVGVDHLVRPDGVRQTWAQFLALSAERLDRNRRQDGVDGVVVGSHEQRPLEPRPDVDPLTVSLWEDSVKRELARLSIAETIAGWAPVTTAGPGHRRHTGIRSSQSGNGHWGGSARHGRSAVPAP